MVGLDHEMVGLSVVLGGGAGQYYTDTMNNSSSKRSSTHHQHQVISKASMNIIKPSSPSPSSSSPTPPTSPSPFTKRNLSSSSSFNQQVLQKQGFLDYCFLCKQKLLPGKDIYMYKGDRGFCSEECRCRQIFMDEEETVKAKTDYCSLAAPSSRKGAKKRANGFAY